MTGYNGATVYIISVRWRTFYPALVLCSIDLLSLSMSALNSDCSSSSLVLASNQMTAWKWGNSGRVGRMEQKGSIDGCDREEEDPISVLEADNDDDDEDTMSFSPLLILFSGGVTGRRSGKSGWMKRRDFPRRLSHIIIIMIILE